MDQEKKTQENAGTAANGPDVVNDLEFNINELANEYINNLDDPEGIYNNNGLFVGMLKYIYKNYLCIVLDNNKGGANRYDYKVLNNIFNIYTDLVYRYKQNKRPSILEYTLFTHVDRNILYNAAAGLTKKLSQEDVDNIKRWFTECENQLTNGSSVFEIFLLKSQYRYNDNLPQIPIEQAGPVMAAGELPDLSIQKIAKKNDK